MAGDKTITYATTGSNAESGCGPATAVTGTGAISGDGAGGGTQTEIDVSADSPDLSAVQAGDILFLDVGSATERWLFEITAVNDSTDIITVADAPDSSIDTGSAVNWAVGGTRANPFSQYSNTRLGDLRWGQDKGWTFELTAGQTFTVSASHDFNYNAAGNLPCILKSTTNGSTATLQWSGSNMLFRYLPAFFIRDITFDANSDWNTGVNSIFFRGCSFYDCVFSNHNGGSISFDNGVVANCTFNSIGSTNATGSYGVYCTANVRAIFAYCLFDGCKSLYLASNDNASLVAVGNIFDSPADDGIEFQLNKSGGGNTNFNTGAAIIGNTISNATNHGINVFNSLASGVLIPSGAIIANNTITDCGGYGINGPSGFLSDLHTVMVVNNHFNSNTSGNFSDSYSGIGDVSGSPGFTDAAGGDFTITSSSPLVDAAIEAP